MQTRYSYIHFSDIHAGFYRLETNVRNIFGHPSFGHSTLFLSFVRVPLIVGIFAGENEVKRIKRD